MKKYSKYLLLLVAAVFTFAACEKKVDREPSPIAPTVAFAFVGSGATEEINMNKEPLEHTVTVFRTTNLDKADTLVLQVEAHAVFNIDTTLIFAEGVSSVSQVVTFPTGESDSTYTFVLTIPEEKRSPYLDGNVEYTYTVSLAMWSEPKVGVWVGDYDCLVRWYSLPEGLAWRVQYQTAELPTGEIKIRILDPYARLPKSENPEPDENGLYEAFPYNTEDDLEGGTSPANVTLIIDPATGEVTLENQMNYLGFIWDPDYGEVFLYDYNDAVGKYDATAGSITFENDGTLASGEGTTLEVFAAFRFYLTVEAYVADNAGGADAEVSTYEGTWKLSAKESHSDDEVEVEVTIESKEDAKGQYYTIKGLHADLPVLKGTFDETSHLLVIAADTAAEVIKGTKTYIPYFTPTDKDGNEKTALSFAPGENDSTIVVAEDSEADRFLIVYVNKDDETDELEGDGYKDITLTKKAAATGAPAKAIKRTHTARKSVIGRL